MKEILLAVAIVSAIGLVAGVMLSVASKLFFVQGDERAEKIKELLPGANCGGCGYSGCEGFAAAVANGEVEAIRCAVASNEAIAEIGSVLGLELTASERRIAYLKCSGDLSATSTRFDYQGIHSCSALSLVHGGNALCEYGCLGCGDCVKACAFGGITMVNGLPHFCPDICVGCGGCVSACPRGLISLTPVSKTHHVGCSSKLKGATQRKICTAGCIGCGKCTKVCEADAILFENNLAFIDTDKCTNCGKCAAACPTNCIS